MTSVEETTPLIPDNPVLERAESACRAFHESSFPSLPAPVIRPTGIQFPEGIAEAAEIYIEMVDACDQLAQQEFTGEGNVASTEWLNIARRISADLAEGYHSRQRAQRLYHRAKPDAISRACWQARAKRLGFDENELPTESYIREFLARQAILGPANQK